MPGKLKLRIYENSFSRKKHREYQTMQILRTSKMKTLWQDSIVILSSFVNFHCPNSFWLPLWVFCSVTRAQITRIDVHVFFALFPHSHKIVKALFWYSQLKADIITEKCSQINISTTSIFTFHRNLINDWHPIFMHTLNSQTPSDHFNVF